MKRSVELGPARPVWAYAPAADTIDPASISPRWDLFIGGTWRAPRSGRYVATLDPSTGAPIAEVAEAGVRDVDAAVRAARVAYDKVWSKMRGAERAKYAFRIARAIKERSRDLGIVESMNGGLPIKDSRDYDLPLAAANFFYYAGWADKLDYAFHGRAWRPLGVAGVVLAADFPLLMAASKIAPALACGNTVVLTPPATAPLTALMLARIIEECDLPPGVVNVVTGATPTGEALAAHAGVDALVFAGRSVAGRKLQHAAAGARAGTRKTVTLELGGTAANVIFADAAIDQAVDAIVGGVHLARGQVRSPASRLLVEEGIEDTVIRKVKDRLATLRIGAPLDRNTDVGAVASSEDLGLIRRLVAACEKAGAERFSPPCILSSKGYWFAPTLFTGPAQAALALEEIVGPVLTVSTFRTAEEAVEKANNTMRGVSAGVWTDRGSRVLWMGQRLKAGVVWGNTHARFDPCAPFGGTRESGFGREGGRFGLHPYVEIE